MQNEDLKVVYMGTPDFAVEPLRRILEAGFHVVGVVTVPDKPAGRGRKLRTSAVKNFAMEKALRILQPDKLRNQEFVDELRNLRADVFVVVAFRMLPEVIWQMPPLGTFNLHASLLPQYRGAAPINWAVINGEKESGVTTFLIDEKIDTGNILLQERILLDKDETAGSLHDKLMVLGADLVVETLEKLCNNRIEPKQQEEQMTLKPAPKIFKEDCRINWEKSGPEIEALIRGLSPYPGAFTNVESEEISGQLKITGAKFEAGEGSIRPVLRVENKQLIVHLPDGQLALTEIQPQGKRKMTAGDFINGIRNKEMVFRLF